MKIKPLALIILDGWGVAAEGDGNAISQAYKPFWNRISVSYPNTTLLAAGEAVGLPGGEAGNSEVGHLNIGAGMIVYQELPRISMSIADGSFLKKPAFIKAADHVKKNKGNLHLLGLIGRGVVHSSLEHLYSLLWFAKSQGLTNVYLHLFTDGRDSPPKSGLEVLKEVTNKLSEIGVGKIATISGRYYAMDRDNRWDRTQKAYKAIAEGIGPQEKIPLKIVSDAYDKGVTDEFIVPTNISESGVHPIKDRDAAIFFNFRPDRARQLTYSFVLPNFTGFPRKNVFKNLFFVTMTEYEKKLPVEIAFPPPIIDYPLAAVLSMNDLRQLHIGETEKYAHVTYFINGGREEPYPGEDRMHIPSLKVATYDEKPEMSAFEITDYVCGQLKKGIYDVYVINFANADMVAHTGNFLPTKKAIEVLDKCLEKITTNILPLGGGVIITGDHGNAEIMVDLTTGGTDTEHSSNPVPFIAVATEFMGRANLKLPSGILADVAPTLLYMLGIEKPGSMSGKNLLI